ncbi:syntaxin [Plasmodium vivax Mauritania I]|uniref:Syntaxin n=1 Tax=Plasmodium vivax Mauritania I TaxID=1035515 RepID=A0A0J9T657_PLAVI|nr:syntaxin [Plasmodium vivax Mauritania I]
MEDILNEIISLSEKKRGGKSGSQTEISQAEISQAEISGGTHHGGTTLHRGKAPKRWKTQEQGGDQPTGVAPPSPEGAAPSSTWDSSTVCSADEDMSAEKASLFSRIISERRRRASGEEAQPCVDALQDAHICADTPQDPPVSERTPLCQQTHTLNSYLLHVNQINEEIACIYKSVDKINGWKQKIDFNIYDSEELNAKISLTICQTEETISNVMKRIFSLNEENKRFERSSNLLSEIKLRANIFIDVVQKYKTCVNKYKNVCHQYYEHVNAKLVKQYRLLCPGGASGGRQSGGRQSSGRQSSGRQSGQRSGSKQSNRRSAAPRGRADLDDIEHFFSLQKNSHSNLGEHVHPENADGINIQKMKARYKELKTLERNISSLNDLYIELAYVVKKRTNYINSIESDVYQVKDYTDDALHNIVAAKRYNALVKRKLFYFSVFLLVVALVILFPVFFNCSASPSGY